jgi:hypothetical protein
MAPFILNLGYGWRQVVNFTPRALYPQYPTPVLSEQEAGGPHSQSRGFGEGKNYMPLPEFKPKIVWPVA